jgi:uncharacterized protein (TIGR03437 family)
MRSAIAILSLPRGNRTVPRWLFNPVSCILPLALLILCIGVPNAQATTPDVTASQTAGTGFEPGACPILPPAQNTFLTTENQVWFNFLYNGGNAGDQYQIQWFEPNGTLYTTDSFTQSSAGGSYCYNWFITIVGYPPASITGTWTVKLVWNGSQINALQFVIATGAVLPPGSVGAAWIYNPPNSYGEVEVFGTAVLPYTACAVVSGALPPGFTFSLYSFSGVNYCYLSGTPTQAGSYFFALTITDSNGTTTSPGLRTIIINPPIAITTSSLPAGTVNTAYSSTLQTSGGTSPFTWTISGSLPLGLSFGSGVVSGTPTQGGDYSFSVTVTDEQLTSASRQFTVSIGGGCTPTALLVTPSGITSGAVLTSGFPVSLEVTVKDNCGNPISSGGSVVASFSNGNAPVLLTSLGNGNWEGTWSPTNVQSQVILTFLAGAGQLTGQASITVTISTSTAVVVPTVSAVTDAASFQANKPLSPGGFITIFGSNLATGTSEASALPLPNNLGGTSVVVGGNSIPMFYASPGQLSAILPYDLPTNTTQQLIVVNGNALSSPMAITVAAADPGVFTSQNQGIAVDYPPTGASFLVSPASPAPRGSVIVIYCAGLGATNPSILAGTSAPLATTTNTTSVTVGGVNAIVEFSGVAPGFTGLYQINAVVPTGGPTGSQVPLVITVAGISSVAVNIAVE